MRYHHRSSTFLKKPAAGRQKSSEKGQSPLDSACFCPQKGYINVNHATSHDKSRIAVTQFPRNRGVRLPPSAGGAKSDQAEATDALPASRQIQPTGTFLPPALVLSGEFWYNIHMTPDCAQQARPTSAIRLGGIPIAVQASTTVEWSRTNVTVSEIHAD
ncbi:MAG: hypothetical protein ACI4WT_13070 [Oligosphaeraceae bacterium]